MTLFLGGPVSGSGVLASAPILAPDPGDGCGCVDLEDAIADLEGGDTYVNVHTLQNPRREIRGR